MVYGENNNMLEKAIQIAVKAHSGQLDKAGEPYILHPLRVMFCLSTEVEKITGVLHDVVEDTHWTLVDLGAEGFSDEVLDALDALTHREEETYEEFIVRAGVNSIGRRVKLADLEDNMDLRRISNPDQKDLERMTKYRKAWGLLSGQG